MIGLYLRRARRKLCEAGVSMANKKVYDDDDGRTIVDMSDTEMMPLLFPRPKRRREQTQSSSGQDLSRDDRRVIVFSAIGSALLIGAIFVAAAAIVIALMLWAWT